MLAYSAKHIQGEFGVDEDRLHLVSREEALDRAQALEDPIKLGTFIRLRQEARISTVKDNVKDSTKAI